jgi:hypothetical protein
MQALQWEVPMQITDIHRAVEALGAELEDEADVIRIWAVFSLASRVGLEAILTAADDPVDAIVEVGSMWADQVAQALEDEPGRQAEILRAAHAVVERLLGVVGAEGLVVPRGRLSGPSPASATRPRRRMAPTGH